MAKLKIVNRYWITPNEVLNNKNLSRKAKGLYWYIQSKPEDWEFAVNRISEDSKDGRDGTASGIKELEDVWYLERRKFKNEKGQWDIEYTLYDTITEKPSRVEEKTITENPLTENPSTEKPETNKERNTNKEKSNKEVLYCPETETFENSIAYKFLEAHIKNQTPWVLYKLKVKSREEVLKNFAGAVEKLKRIDKYTEEQISFIINYLIQNNKEDKPLEKFYWLDQIQTIDKLREKNKEKIPYFVALIDPAKKHFISNKSLWTLEI